MKKTLELTLAIIKPHVVANPIALRDIQQLILATDFKIVQSQSKQLTKNDAALFYKEHSGKFFYNRLITFMTSGPLELYVMARHDAIKCWRNMMGPTKVYKTQFSNPDTIRGKYGLSDTRNASHGSDSPESAVNEIKFFFPHFNIDEWYQRDEVLFRDDNNLHFDKLRFIHELKKIACSKYN